MIRALPWVCALRRGVPVLGIGYFFDESGHPEDPNCIALSVAGAFASASHWVELTQEWNSTLNKYGISALHMKEYAHSVGQYSDWKGKEDHRRQFLKDLFKIIERHIYGYVGATIPMSVFDSSSNAQKIRFENNPYYPCLQVCMIKAALQLLWIRYVFPDFPIGEVDFVVAESKELRDLPYRVFLECKNHPGDYRLDKHQGGGV